MILLISTSALAQQSFNTPTRQTQYPAGVNPSYFNPNKSIFEWKIKDSWPPTEPCHWNEPAGMWVGDCTGSLDTPGFSITTPRTIRK